MLMWAGVGVSGGCGGGGGGGGWMLHFCPGFGGAEEEQETPVHLIAAVCVGVCVFVVYTL